MIAVEPLAIHEKAVQSTPLTARLPICVELVCKYRTVTCVGVMITRAVPAFVGGVLKSCRATSIWPGDGVPGGGGTVPAGMCLAMHVDRVRSHPPYAVTTSPVTGNGGNISRVRSP